MSDPHADLRRIGHELLGKLATMPDGDLAGFLLSAVADPNEQGSVAAALYTAVVDARAHAGQHGVSPVAAVGVAAGLTGHTSDVYQAARLGSDVRAVERTVETGDPRFVERRAKNVIVGRTLGKAGVWRKLWR